MEKIPTDEEIRYDIARKRVKKIKDFYVHLLIYICINILIVFLNISNLEPGESYFQPKNFLTAFFWGIGILCHAFSVFGIDVFFGKNWEERKIKEIMDKDQHKKWQ
jgi:hypothetical protein